MSKIRVTPWKPKFEVAIQRSLFRLLGQSQAAQALVRDVIREVKDLLRRDDENDEQEASTKKQRIRLRALAIAAQRTLKALEDLSNKPEHGMFLTNFYRDPFIQRLSATDLPHPTSILRILQRSASEAERSPSVGRGRGGNPRSQPSLIVCAIADASEKHLNASASATNATFRKAVAAVLSACEIQHGRLGDVVEAGLKLRQRNRSSAHGPIRIKIRMLKNEG